MGESDMQVDSDDVCEVCDDQPRCAESQSASSVEVTDAQLRAAYETILRAIGEDPNREGLRKTPARAAKAMRALCSGYAIQPTQLARDALFTVEARSKEPLGMVVVASASSTTSRSRSARLELGRRWSGRHISLAVVSLAGSLTGTPHELRAPLVAQGGKTASHRRLPESKQRASAPLSPPGSGTPWVAA